MQDQEYILWLVSRIKDATVRDTDYYASEDELIRFGQKAVPALSELASSDDDVAADRAKEIIRKIQNPPAL